MLEPVDQEIRALHGSGWQPPPSADAGSFPKDIHFCCSSFETLSNEEKRKVDELHNRLKSDNEIYRGDIKPPLPWAVSKDIHEYINESILQHFLIEKRFLKTF